MFTMSSGVGAGDNPDSNAYVFAVARALNAETIRRWDAVTFDAVVVLSKQFRYYSGRHVLIAWNRYFGVVFGNRGSARRSGPDHRRARDRPPPGTGGHRRPHRRARRGPAAPRIP
ncbi:hypothetical protein RHA1_ro08357 (plasmid) [Rhodococcus jostii RHA1]|uniref:Uncharacterized protein n=1 Tax=Rhodococcus jostii (strain RHA1) TaxID=101510 RepID=Q0RZ85_RHOJR|nr:hypothetical protein RHA1_ro08357 [Rhodococcus jostii RHA1]